MGATRVWPCPGQTHGLVRPVLTVCGAWCCRVTEFNYQAPCASSARSPNVSQTLQARLRTSDVQEKQLTVCSYTRLVK